MQPTIPVIPHVPVAPENTPSPAIAAATEELPAADTLAQARQVTEAFHKTFAPILFAVNKVAVQAGSLPVIDEAAKMLAADQAATITINGYTDITGTAAYNKVLSLKRANAVKTLLVLRGIDRQRIKTKGNGSKHPAASNKTKEGRMKNRRAVKTLVDSKQP